NLNDRLTSLENCLSAILPFLCSISHSSIMENPENVQKEIENVLRVELNDKNSIVLDQNIPNPFAEQTTINYSVPETVQKAEIHFYSQNGMLIKTVELTERGAGQIIVYGGDLSSGVYTYTLVADG